ncbi:small protein A [Candidatus Kinetoplastibacterium desouzaii TCC079E]|uniref:Outer membrane protein assembly factor BamE n=1 Tax=Candidatus Kinetoplastidibacterium desouzai TCC079E TaxID=1208919 RepID=M1LUV9_9PROT|nr:outer membrane protein assembly factor BamE [Candidatus Kinetoplastibacterium desouzaii]AGF47079.1 small protein A [Candidatus Kinetoplastibacterium desouzaii TCC079E]
MKYNNIKNIILVTIILTVNGCCYKNINFPYVPEINQGNCINLEQQKMLKIGMSKKQALQILGTPAVKDNNTNIDKWEYIHYSNYYNNRQETKIFTLCFKDGKLINFSGDDFPQQQEYTVNITKKLDVTTE